MLFRINEKMYKTNFFLLIKTLQRLLENSQCPLCDFVLCTKIKYPPHYTAYTLILVLILYFQKISCLIYTTTTIFELTTCAVVRNEYFKIF